jgi:hypothetical protein
VKDFNRHYSSEFIDAELLGTGDALAKTFTSALDFLPVKASTVVVTADTITGTDNGLGVIAGTGITGTVDYVTGAISVTFTAAPALNIPVNAAYSYNMEGNTNVPQINIDITLQEVKAKTRKLKALWSSEAADDLKAFHGIDAESEIVSGVAAEIALELDREIIMDLYNGAALFPRQFDVTTIPTATPEIFHLRSLITTLTMASNTIHKSSLRGPANFMVTGPDVSTFIEQLETHGDFRPVFSASTGSDAQIENPHTFGVYKVGTLASKYVVYKDPYFPVTNPGSGTGTGDILMGYKGSTFIDAGYVWAPYVPLQITATFLDPSDFVMRKGMRTRYATKMVRPEFYRKVRVVNI